jgi:hypothetical protein
VERCLLERGLLERRLLERRQLAGRYLGLKHDTEDADLPEEAGLRPPPANLRL